MSAAPAQDRRARTPTRSAGAQRVEALRRANTVRTRRAQIKQDLKAGRRMIDRLLAEPPVELATMTVGDLLICVPRYGQVKVDKLLARAQLSPAKTVGALSERQRGELRRMLRATSAEGGERSHGQPGHARR